MDDARQSLSPDELADLEEDIQIQATLLLSLEHDTDTESEEAKATIKKTLKKLRKRLKASESAPPTMPNISNTDGSNSPRVKAEESNDMSSSERKEHLMPPPTFDLVSRKRQRDDFDADLPESKSLRQSPSLATISAASPAPSNGSVDSFDYDDPFMRTMFGEDVRKEAQEHKAYLRSLEERKRQEEQDAEFARQLQEQFNQAEEPLPSQQSQRYTPSSFSQSLLRPNGSINQFRQEPRQDPVPVQPQPSQTSFGTPVLVDSGRSTPNSEGFAEIPASDFVPRFRAGLNPSQQLQPPSYAIPGAFPGSTAYSSVGGASVYGQSHGAPSQAYGGSTGVSGLQRGSPYAPWNVDDLPPAPAPWEESYADPAKTQEEIKDLLKHIRPDEELTPQQRAETPVGLTKTLMPHQAAGLAWMKKQEDGTNKGGILADDMGLGKTVQAISLILARPPPDDQHCPTLIIAPVALLQQWQREIEKFVQKRHRLAVLIAHGSQRPQRYLDIKHHHVVLTSYGYLAAELKKKYAWEEKLKRDPDAQRSPKEECVFLADNAKFHRIILDEAQQIKNKIAKQSIAACHVQATYRWCLTGTPMQNNVEEMYSLIRFCRIRPYDEISKFQRDIGRPLKNRSEHAKEKAMQQLQALLRAILLRRTKSSEIDGKPILQLPPKNTVEDRAIFSSDELEFYKALEAKAQIQFNKYVRAGSVGRNYSNALVLLLRLRQACCNPMLIVNSKDFMQSGELEPMSMIENAKELSENAVERLKEWDGFECPVCMDADENPTIFPCGHALCSECLSKLCDAALSSEEGSKATCPNCRSKIDANKVTDLASFLRVHCPDREGVEPLNEDEQEVSESDSDESDDESDDGADLRDFIVDDDEIEYDSDADERVDRRIKKLKSEERGKKSKSRSSSRSKRQSGGRRQSKGKGKAQKKNKSLAELRKEGLRSKKAKKKYLHKLAKNFKSSTKIEKTMSLLEEIHNRGEDEKTIVFSNFTSFLDLLEVPLSRHPNFSVYARYDGSMSPVTRNEAVLNFTDNKHCKVILVSLRAGNAGLNLTAANHVIMLDPFWNPFVEFQAADRCHRIGQERDVTVHRVLIGEADANGNLKEMGEDEDRQFTVEDRILILQEKKRQLVETALDERAGERVGRLGVRELGYLFGVNNLN